MTSNTANEVYRLDDKDREIYRLQTEVAEWQTRWIAAEKMLRFLRQEVTVGRLQVMVEELKRLRAENAELRRRA